MLTNIVVFDSGVGGLSILSEIKRTIPHANYFYVFDNDRLPYGELKEDELIVGCVNLIETAVAQVGADIVVVACNSASTLILPILRRQLSIPIVGVVPAVKPAALISASKHIGLLATPGTVNRRYTRELIDEYAADCVVELFGSSQLVLLAEQKMAQQAIDQPLLVTLLAPIKQSGIDTLVLGCTHFPILKPELQCYFGDEITLLDSAPAIAARVNALMKSKTKATQPAKCEALYTAAKISKGLEKTLQQWDFLSITRLTE